MVTHFIFMSSSYFLGTRIALDYILTDSSVQEKINKDLDKITGMCGKDVSLSTHMIQADDESWKSVCVADHFFKDVKVIDSLEKFIFLILKDRKLQGVDIAKYVLSRVTCTQLKLQKLVYLCYADYLCNTGKELFTDKIYAYKYGPVVDSVYNKYKKYGYNRIDKETGDIDSNDVYELPARSRILFAVGGIEKIISIDKTLRKYGNLSASELVELTHRQDTPWSKTKTILGASQQIKKETIVKYHQYEDVQE